MPADAIPPIPSRPNRIRRKPAPTIGITKPPSAKSGKRISRHECCTSFGDKTVRREGRPRAGNGILRLIDNHLIIHIKLN